MKQARRDVRRDGIVWANKFAVYGCAMSLLILAVLSLGSRWLVDDVDTPRALARRSLAKLDDLNSDEVDARIHCSDVFLIRPDEEEDRSELLCQRALDCDGQWLSTTLLPFILCNNGPMGNPRTSLETGLIFAMLPALILVYLVLLFRLLATTADSYFSPALESFSFELGLPPRFAGATLLALGNGSPDLGSTVNSILLWNEEAAREVSSGLRSGHQEGWTMALGSLIGGGMFVGTVVCGLLLNICGGISCRSSFLRDVMFYALSIGVVWRTLAKGRVTSGDIIVFIGMYLGYVVTVLCSDLYHKKVTLERLRAEGKERRKSEKAKILSELRNEVTFADSESTRLLQTESSCYNAEAPISLTSDGQHDGADNDFNNIPPLRGLECGERIRGRLSFADRFGMLLSNYDPKSVKWSGLSKSSSGGSVGDADSEWTNITSVLHQALPTRRLDSRGRHGSWTMRLDSRGRRGSWETTKDDELMHSQLQNTLDSAHEEESLKSLTPHERHSFMDAIDETAYYFRSLWNGCFAEGNSSLEIALMVLEFPFTVIRSATIPNPNEDHYCRAVVSVSISLAPFYILWYLSKGPSCAAFVYILLSFVLGLAVLLYAGDEKMPLIASVPISLYGFGVAALYIDVIAELLVDCLEFIGIVSRVHSTVLGLTILAYGNSLGDLSANLAMARKGMPDMATTAVFSGPAFNLLLGLGLGFWALQRKNHSDVIAPLTLIASVEIGFIFIIANCLFIVVFSWLCFKFRLPPGYSYFQYSLYFFFIVISFKSALS